MKILSGKVDIIAPLERGMVKIGRQRDDYTLNGVKSLIALTGKITFNGYCSIGQNFLIRVYGGDLKIGNKVWIGQSVSIDCNKSISISEGSSITYSSIISDSNHHYVRNADGIVGDMEKAIYIGKYNWIGNNSYIDKGTKTTDGCIIAHHSLLNKDYMKQNSNTNEPLFLAGSPAVIKGKGCTRVFSSVWERFISDKIKESNTGKIILPQSFTDEVELRYFL